MLKLLARYAESVLTVGSSLATIKIKASTHWNCNGDCDLYALNAQVFRLKHTDA